VKKIVSASVTIFLLLATISIPTASSAAPDLKKYAWPPSYNTGNYGQQPLLGYYFTLVDDFTQGNTGEGFSFIRVLPGSQRWCKDFNDAQCIKEIETTGGNFWTNQVLPPCENERDLINCIEAVNLVDEQGNKEKLVLEKLIPGNTWPSDATQRLEAGSSSSRWIKASGIDAEKGFKVTVSGSLGLVLSSRTKVSGAKLNSFQASVEPYEKITGPYEPNKIYETASYRGFGGNVPDYCVWVDTNECGVQTDFPKDTKVELVLHLPTEISGWLLGRVDQPVFESKYLGLSRITGQSLNRVTLSAFPVKVPLFSAKVDLANASPELNSHYQENKFCKDKLRECTGYFGGFMPGSSFDGTYRIFKFFEKSFNDTANIVIPRWSIRSLSRFDGIYDRCRFETQAGINGIVSTNSSIYQGAPPEFEENEFVYRVAGLHLLPNKEVFQGTYDLVLKSDFARCLYGFSKAPLTASVQVTNADGANKVVTNTFTEKNGWIYVSIKGFTFSQPTIKLKLSQEKAVVLPSPTPTPAQAATPSPSPVSVRRSTITCVKGKMTKKVTATNPKCPAGYKKK
jgi:hypothetical protein